MKSSLTLLLTTVTVASLLAGTAQAQTTDRIPVGELKPLLKIAIYRG